MGARWEPAFDAPAEYGGVRSAPGTTAHFAAVDEYEQVMPDTALYACRRCGVVVVAAGREVHADLHEGQDAAFRAAGG